MGKATSRIAKHEITFWGASNDTISLCGTDHERSMAADDFSRSCPWCKEFF
jgi:hypothetical protein